MKLGEFVRQQREKSGLSQEAVALTAGLGRNTVFNLENSSPIRIDNLRKICLTVLKVSPAAWKEVLTLWLKELLGTDFDLYAVEQAAAKLFSDERGAQDDENTRCLTAFKKLPPNGRVEILKAMDRPEMIENIRALNSLFDKLRAG